MVVHDMSQEPKRGIFIPFELVVWSAFLVGFWIWRSDLRTLLRSTEDDMRALDMFLLLSGSLGFLVFSYEQPREAGSSFDLGWLLLVALVGVPAFGWAVIHPSWPEAAVGAAATWAVFLITRPRHILALRRVRWLSRQVFWFVVLLLILVGSAVVTGVVLLVFWESTRFAESLGLPFWVGI